MRNTILFFSLILLSISGFSQSWKTFPHHQTGTHITFPDDEGRHPSEPVEWWYSTAHLVGDSTGNEYSFMISYFYFPTLTDGFRVLNVANETAGTFHAETLLCNYDELAEDSLFIRTTPIGASGEEEWSNVRAPGGAALPFEYYLKASSANGAIDLVYDTYKRPLIVGDTGLFDQGESAYTYYYTISGINATGTFTIDGITETVTGSAWIDRQYGTNNPSTGEKYEWFSIQLDNGMDLNIWNIFTPERTVPDNAKYRLCSMYINDSTDTTITDFSIERLAFDWTDDNVMCYPQQWHMVIGDIDIMVSADHPDNEVSIPFRFYEGVTSISGTVGGTPVTGVGFAELLHGYEHPNIDITSPSAAGAFMDNIPISWDLLNPDDGRTIWYDLEYSLDNGSTWDTLITGTTDMSFNWDISGVAVDTDGKIKITGYSIDTVMVNTVTSETLGLNVGLVDGFLDNHIEMFPNPSIGQLQISLEHALNEKGTVLVKDLAGRIISEWTLHPNEKDIIIDLKELSSGVILVELISGNERFVRKIVVE